MKRFTKAYQLIRENTPDPFYLRHNLRGYSPGDAKYDLRAGLNVALMAFPQGMAYALLAGLPIQHGLYCAAIAMLVAPMFCTSRFTSIGPSNATSIMMAGIFMTLPAGIRPEEVLSLLVLMVAVFLIAAAFLRLANMINFISQSVIIGYISGAALLIIVNQSPNVLGLKKPEGATTFFDVLGHTLQSLPQTNLATLSLGFFTLIGLFFLRQHLPALPAVFVMLIVAAFMALGLSWAGHTIPRLEAVPVGTWPFTPPTVTFSLINLLIGPAMALAFLAALENAVMSKTLASRSGQVVNSNQEMFGLGMSNLASGLFGGQAASASLTRSALNYQSGARSPVASITTGLLVGIGAISLGRLVAYIPTAALAAVVISVALSLFNFKQIRIALKSTKSDATVLIITFTATLLTPLHVAIFIGVAASIALFLKKAGSPQLVEYTFNEEGNLCEVEQKRDNPHISIIHVEGELFFGAADLFRDQIRRVCLDPNLQVVILRMRNARHLDATSVMALEDLITFLRAKERHLLISGATKEVYRVLRNSGLLETLDRENLFMGSVRNPNLATRNALKRAQKLIGGKADVRIFYDPNKKKENQGA